MSERSADENESAGESIDDLRAELLRRKDAFFFSPEEESRLHGETEKLRRLFPRVTPADFAELADVNSKLAATEELADVPGTETACSHYRQFRPRCPPGETPPRLLPCATPGCSSGSNYSDYLCIAVFEGRMANYRRNVRPLYGEKCWLWERLR